MNKVTDMVENCEYCGNLHKGYVVASEHIPGIYCSTNCVQEIERLRAGIPKPIEFLNMTTEEHIDGNGFEEYPHIDVSKWYKKYYRPWGYITGYHHTLYMHDLSDIQEVDYENEIDHRTTRHRFWRIGVVTTWEDKDRLSLTHYESGFGEYNGFNTLLETVSFFSNIKQTGLDLTRV